MATAKKLAADISAATNELALIEGVTVEMVVEAKAAGKAVVAADNKLAQARSTVQNRVGDLAACVLPILLAARDLETKEIGAAVTWLTTLEPPVEGPRQIPNAGTADVLTVLASHYFVAPDLVKRPAGTIGVTISRAAALAVDLIDASMTTTADAKKLLEKIGQKGVQTKAVEARAARKASTAGDVGQTTGDADQTNGDAQATGDAGPAKPAEKENPAAVLARVARHLEIRKAAAVIARETADKLVADLGDGWHIAAVKIGDGGVLEFAPLDLGRGREDAIWAEFDEHHGHIDPAEDEDEDEDTVG